MAIAQFSFKSLRQQGRSRTMAALATALGLALALPVANPGVAHADSTGMSALVSMDCSHGRLQLVLDNQTSSSQTFTIAWPGRSGSPWTRTVAAGGNSLLYWTVGSGTAYNLQTTTPTGFTNTQTGTSGCGMGTGTPQMNSTTVLTTSSQISGLVDANGNTYTGTSAYVRIPALAVTNKGTVIAVADARITSSADLPNNIQVAMVRSTDSGNTWSAPAIIRHAATSNEGTGDSSLLVDRSTGRVYCFYNYGPQGIGWNSAASGSNSATDPNSIHIQYITSDDDGVTWSAPVELNPQVKDPSWQSLFASSGHGIQLSSGRLVQPLAYRDSSGVTHAADMYSDDHGSTWHTGGSAGTNVNESKAIERSTGNVDQNMRDNSAGFRDYATSTNQGTTFGSQWVSSLIDPACNADEISYLKPTDVSGGNPIRTASALFSNNRSSSSRVDLTVRTSTNDGGAWQHYALLAPGTAGYSTMAVLNDGSVGDLYEIGSTGGIVFDRFTMAWVNNS